MGIRSRKIMTIMLAAFAVALMIAVPLFAAVDTDADFTEESAGYSIDMVNPTDAQLDKVNVKKYSAIQFVLMNEMEIFDTAFWGEPTTMTMDSYAYQHSEGGKVTTNQNQDIVATVVKAENVKIEFTIAAACDLFVPEDEMSAPQKEAAKAIETYLGGKTLAVGDKITLTGKINEEFAADDCSEYKMLADNKCIRSKETVTWYVLDDLDLTITFTKGSDAKDIGLVSTVKGMIVDEDRFEYASEDIQIGTAYSIKNEVSSLLSGKTYYKVDGKECSLILAPEQDPTIETTVTSLDIKAQSSIVVPNYIKNRAAGLPDSEEGMTIGKEYSNAQSMFDNVTMDAVGKDILDALLLIIGIVIAVIVIIIILVIVLIVLKKKKK